MKLVTFDSYEEYCDIQVGASRLKHDLVFAEEPELRTIAAHYRAHGIGQRGFCHGVRNGYEVLRLRRLLPTIDLRGTDLAPTAATIPHCFVWDMHEIQPEWIGRIDFLYSNAWDHTYDPHLLFSRWQACLSPRGCLYVSYSALHSERFVSAQSKVDVFGCSLRELTTLLAQYFQVEQILNIAPRLTRQMWQRRLILLRSQQWRAALTARLRSRPLHVVVCRPRVAEAPG